MSKTETLRQSAAAMNEMRIERVANQIEAVRQAKLQSVEDLAALIEPLAQALAALTDETKQTLIENRQELIEINREGREQVEKFNGQFNAMAKEWKKTNGEAQKIVNGLNQVAQRMELRHYAMVLLTALVTAVLVSGFWFWLAPKPTVQNQLNPQTLAEFLKPALIEALRPPSKGK